jgi:hypothetical protein
MLPNIEARNSTGQGAESDHFRQSRIMTSSRVVERSMVTVFEFFERTSVPWTSPDGSLAIDKSAMDVVGLFDQSP